MSFTFRVDLRGVVDLLSHHLYATPRVYVRELLQNAVDAITARRLGDPTAPGEIRFEPAERTGDGTLRVHDTGIGLSEAQAHELAVSRPVRDPVDAGAFAGALWAAARLVLLAPLAAISLFAAGLLALSVLPVGHTGQLCLAPLVPLGAAAVLAAAGRWWTPRKAGITLLSVAVTAPAFVFSTLIYLLPSGMFGKLPLHLPAYLVFFGGLAVLLHAVHRRAAAGRRRGAWLLGGLGALALADVAVALPVLLSAGEDPPLLSAPLWLLAGLLGGGPAGYDDAGWMIADTVEFDPFIFLLTAGLAVGVAVAAAARPASSPRAEVAARP